MFFPWDLSGTDNAILSLIHIPLKFPVPRKWPLKFINRLIQVIIGKFTGFSVQCFSFTNTIYFYYLKKIKFDNLSLTFTTYLQIDSGASFINRSEIILKILHDSSIHFINCIFFF